MEKSKKQSRTLSKETASEPSFRVYYGEKGATVPFKWESQPGTPKHGLFSDYDTLPPLTPPPSYLARSHRESDDQSPRNPKSKNHRQRKLKVVVLLTAIPRLIKRGSHVSPSSYSSSPSMSSSSELVPTYYSKSRKTRSPKPLMFALMDEDLGEERIEGRGRMCFGGMKNALFSVVGCRRRSSAVDYYDH